MSVQVELIYDLDCPNVREARETLLRAFTELNITARWTEWSRSSSESPAYVRQYGSPTVLVNGQDVAGAKPSGAADCCRVYPDDSAGLRGVPPVSRIVAALRRAGPSTLEGGSGRPWRLRYSLTTLPGVGAALLPVGGCPACWPVYSAALASLGLTFLLDPAYLLWITLAFLCAALLVLTFRAKAKKIYGPLVLGAASAALILLFKFVWMIAPIFYAGLFGLAGASLWDAWVARKNRVSECPACGSSVQ